MLSFCLKTTQFACKCPYYQQVFVTAMGSPVSAVIANMVMEDVEQRALATSPVKPFFWKRYVDDVISAVSGNEAERLLSHLNSVEPSIQFTLCFAVIPYIQGVTELIKRILNSHNVKVAQKSFQTLGHIFAKPKDPVTKEQRTDAIYSIPCNDCDNEYIGQTKRQFGTRLKEHQKAVFFCKKENSALSGHRCLTNHTIG